MADRKLYTSDIAELLGITESTWRGYCTESASRKRQAPPADGTDIDQGHARQWWWESTIQRWQEHRPGRGRQREPDTRQEAPAAPSQMRREDERSLWLNIALAAKLILDPDGVIVRTKTRLEKLRTADSGGRSAKWFDLWEKVLAEGADAVIAVMTSRTDEAQALRSASPVPDGLLTAEERTQILESFRAHWRTTHRQAA